jgi:4-hydroxy-2-oxoheptanedioate aldolase
MRPNSLKEKLRRGEWGRGVSIMIPCVQVVEMLGRIGFDWVLLDCEHGTLTVESLESLTLAAEASGITAIARPRGKTPEHLQEVLERGVMGVQVPHVNTAEEAREVVSSVKFHPEGSRGLAAATRPAGYGLGERLDDYTVRSNEQTLVCVQIEDRAALEQLPEMLKVPQIDVFFVGPSDLSQSLGHPGRPDHPEVRSAMANAFDAIRAAGRIAGCAGGPDRWSALGDQGVRYLYTHLPSIIERGSRPFLDPASLANAGSNPPLTPVSER